MKSYKILITLFIIFLLAVSGCKSSKESKITGLVNYNSSPFGGVNIEIYLQKSKDKSRPPFQSGETGADGTFTITLPPGRYYIIAKKRFIDSGITKMLFGEYPKNPVVLKSGKIVKLAPFSLFDMGGEKYEAAEGAGVTGKVIAANGDAKGAYLYVYPETNPNMIGPSYVVARELKADGAFKINLLPGKYHIAARQRVNRTKLGYLNIGDLTVDYKKNPMEVKSNDYLDLGELTLRPVDEKKLDGIKNDTAALEFGTKIIGNVSGEDEGPVRGVYIYAYKDSKMVGKPEAISKKSDSKGNYVLYIPASSTKKYYIGARSTFGGPLEPGEYVGTYNENQEHKLDIAGKRDITGIDIIVKEVW